MRILLLPPFLAIEFHGRELGPHASRRGGIAAPVGRGYPSRALVSSSNSPSESSSAESSPDIPTDLVSKDTYTSSVLTELHVVDIEAPCGFNSIANFRSDWITGPTKPDSYNDDLIMSRFEPISKIRAGGETKEISVNIPDSTARSDHAEEAARSPFRLSDSVPLPPEVISAANYLARTDRRRTNSGWLGIATSAT